MPNKQERVSTRTEIKMWHEGCCTCSNVRPISIAVVQDILETWRLRTPNEWERVSTWSDIMLWRNVIYNIVINAFQSVKDVAPHLHQLGYRDRAWSVNR